MIIVMLSGSLSKQPETRQSKNGNSYALASICVQTAEGDLFASVTAFGDLADTLERLTKAGLSVTASRIMALVDHQSVPRSKSNGPRRRLADAQIGPPHLPPLEAYNDAIPF